MYGNMFQTYIKLIMNEIFLYKALETIMFIGLCVFIVKNYNSFY